MPSDLSSSVRTRLSPEPVDLAANRHKSEVVRQSRRKQIGVRGSKLCLNSPECLLAEHPVGAIFHDPGFLDCLLGESSRKLICRGGDVSG